MTAFFTNTLLVFAAISLGLRTTALLTRHVHPAGRMILSLVIGALFVATALQLSERYQVYDMGLGLLLSLSPVGAFDLAKWWFRWGN